MLRWYNDRACAFPALPASSNCTKGGRVELLCSREAQPSTAQGGGWGCFRLWGWGKLQMTVQSWVYLGLELLWHVCEGVSSLALGHRDPWVNCKCIHWGWLLCTSLWEQTGTIRHRWLHSECNAVTPVLKSWGQVHFFTMLLFLELF